MSRHHSHPMILVDAEAADGVSGGFSETKAAPGCGESRFLIIELYRYLPAIYSLPCAHSISSEVKIAKPRVHSISLVNSRFSSVVIWSLPSLKGPTTLREKQSAT